MTHRPTALAQYLDLTGETQEAFAARVGTTQSVISRIVAGKLRPGTDLALRIHEATHLDLKTLLTRPEGEVA